MSLWGAVWLLAAPAFAQESPPPESAVEEPSDADLEAAALYRIGLDLVAAGRYTEGCQTFERLAEQYPDSPHALKAEEQMALAALVEGGEACGGAPPSAVAPTRAPVADVRPADNGLVELTVSQGIVGPALFGLFLPLSVCGDDGCHDALYLSGALVGLAGGISVPLLVGRRYPISQGQAMLLYTGEYVGGLNGAMLQLVGNPSPDTSPLFRLITAGTVLGGVAGAAAGIAIRPSAGQVSMFRSGFSWGAYSAAISFLVWPADEADGVVTRLVLMADAGAVFGAILAGVSPIGRARMNLINLSGYAGAGGLALVYGLGVALSNSDADQNVMFAVLAAGAVGGFTTGILLTRRMDDDAVAFLGRGAILGIDGERVVVGVPMPAPRLTRDGRLGVQLSLAHGTF